MNVADQIEAMRDCRDQSAEVRFVCHYRDYEAALTIHEIDETARGAVESVLYLPP